MAFVLFAVVEVSIHASGPDEIRTLGLRAAPSGFHWAIVRGMPEQPILDASDTETAPYAYKEAESLAWIREKTVYIIERFRPTKVGVRFAERTARGPNKDSAKRRCRVEGVLLEVSGSRGLDVVAGTLNTFGKHLGSKSPKEDLTSDDLRGLDWSKYRDNGLREAILVAVSLLSSV